MPDSFSRLVLGEDESSSASKSDSINSALSRSIKPAQSPGIISSFGKGLQHSAIGELLSIGDAPDKPEELDFFDRLSSTVGELVADLPVMSAGALGGTALGGPIGGAAAAFAAPSLIKNVIREYKDHVAKGNDITFGEFIERAGRVGTETGKSAITGAAVGAVGKFLPLLAKIPGAQKILSSKAGSAIVGGAAEVGALTGTQSAFKGELPSAEDVLESALLVGGFKAASAGARKAKSVVKERAGGKTAIDIAKKMIPEKVKAKVLSKTPDIIKDMGRFLDAKRMTEQKQKHFKELRKFTGERDAEFVRSSFDWKEKLTNLKKAQKVTEKDLSDMIYYRQKTGNPKVKGDTFDKLSERLGKPAKEFVDNNVDSHLKKSLKAWNENPLTKNIQPREGLEDIYLPGLYEYDAKKFARATADVSKRFKGKNPLANEKVFLSYLDAYEKAGLKPKYNNIIDIMQAYDKTMIKSMANTKLIEKIRTIEKETGKPLVVNSTSPEMYKEAKTLGYEPFMDPFLRQYTPDGKFNLSQAPALVDPDFAQAFQGVFSRDAYKPGNPFGRAYDNVGNTIRHGRVSFFTPFHYVALLESSFGASGVKGWNIPRIMREGKLLTQNKDFMVDAAKSGLKLHKPVIGLEKGKKAFQKLAEGGLKLLPEKTPGKAQLEAGVGKLLKAKDYLFDQFHPNMKASTWGKTVAKEIARRQKGGKFLPESEVTQIKRDLADYTNNIFGGQMWDTMRFTNNPRTRKWMSRMVGYPDWTVSAIKQAASAFSPGFKGAMARKYWLKYGIGMAGITGAMKFMYNGMVQTDKENSSISGIGFDFKRAVDRTLKDQPGTWFKIPLPDLDVKVAGMTINPGRNERGEKLYTHFGKQALELGNYIRPTNQAFVKSNPLIQMFLKQVTGLTPYKDQYFTVRGAYKGGKFMPWEASKEWTTERAVSRGKQLVDDVLPFGFKALYTHGLTPYMAAGFGGVPISKGMSLYKSEEYIEKALRNNNAKELNFIKKSLKENKYSSKQINRRISRVRNMIKNEKKGKKLRPFTPPKKT